MNAPTTFSSLMSDDRQTVDDLVLLYLFLLNHRVMLLIYAKITPISLVHCISN